MVFKRIKKLALVVILAWAGIIALVVMNAHSVVLEKENQLLLPGLMQKINDVAFINIKGNQSNLLFAKNAGNWLESHRNYPVRSDQINSLLYGLGQATIVEPKTLDPKLYYKLGLDLDSKNSKAIEILLANKDRKIINKIILGARSSWHIDPVYNDSIYMRTHKARAWLVKTNLPKEIEDFSSWFAHPLQEFNNTRKIIIKDPSSTLEIVREQDNCILQNIAQGERVKNPNVINQIFNTVLHLKFSDVILRQEESPTQLELIIYSNNNEDKIKLVRFKNDMYAVLDKVRENQNLDKYLFKIKTEDLALLQHKYQELVEKIN